MLLSVVNAEKKVFICFNFLIFKCHTEEITARTRIKQQQKGSQKLETKQRQRIKVEGNKYAGDKLSGHHSSTDPSACGRSDSAGGHRSNVSASGKVRYCRRLGQITRRSCCRRRRFVATHMIDLI